jgi:integrase
VTELRVESRILTEVQLQDIAAAVKESRSPNTRRAYASAWRQWDVWCGLHGFQALPADPLTVAAYMTDRAKEGRSVSTLDTTRAAISAVHRNAGQQDPTVNPGVALVLKGLKRKRGSAPRTQAHPLTTDELRRIVDGIDRASLRGKRDVALILLGFAGAFRRSELAALDVGDLSFKPDGVVITLRHSKGDQEGRGVVVGILRGRIKQSDAVYALKEWISASGVGDRAPLFQRIAWSDRRTTGQSISGDTVNNILQARSAAAGLADLRLTGHSLRAGHATTAAENGVPSDRLARTTRHKNLATLSKYVRPAEVLRDSSSGSLGL